MKTLLLIFTLTLSLFAADAKKEEPKAVQKPEPITLSKKVPAVVILPDGKLELKDKSSWEDAAYALLDTAKNLESSARSCYAELEKKSEKKK